MSHRTLVLESDTTISFHGHWLGTIAITFKDYPLRAGQIMTDDGVYLFIITEELKELYNLHYGVKISINVSPAGLTWSRTES